MGSRKKMVRILRRGGDLQQACGEFKRRDWVNQNRTNTIGLLGIMKASSKVAVLSEVLISYCVMSTKLSCSGQSWTHPGLEGKRNELWGNCAYTRNYAYFRISPPHKVLIHLFLPLPAQKMKAPPTKRHFPFPWDQTFELVIPMEYELHKEKSEEMRGTDGLEFLLSNLFYINIHNLIKFL